MYVNPIPMGSEDWSRYFDTTKDKLKYGGGGHILGSMFRFISDVLSSKLSSALCGGTHRSRNCKRS